MQDIIPVPQKVRNFTSFPITKLISADESSLALTINGDLFVWGKNKDNLFGLGNKRKVIWEPTRVSLNLFMLIYVV